MSEFRQDLVSGDWIIIAPERTKRPNDFLPKKKPRVPPPLAECPFENLQKSGNWPPIATYPSRKKWRIAVVPNKFPALAHVGKKCAVTRHDGPYKAVSGIGHHELLITRDHRKNFGALVPAEAFEVFKMFEKRFRVFVADPCIEYVSTFFNWGPLSGASLFHPHFQILGMPIIPPDVAHSLHGSKRYFEANNICVHCVMIKKERKDRVRIIAENKHAIVTAPYASHEPFEMRVYPKRHLSYFERTPESDLRGVVAMLQAAITRMRKFLNDPDFNFFIHTSPVKNQSAYAHYHWHIEIVPKVSTLGGFELSTGVIINSIEPAVAARMLRGGKATSKRKP